MRVAITTACTILFLVAAFPLSAAPVKELWSVWAQNDPGSTATIDHAAWDAFLKKYVQDDPNDPLDLNRVDYAGVTDSDRQTLATYIGTLAATTVTSLNRGEQQAYWINLYNALTVQVILDHMPVETIQDIDISPGLFSSGPWGKKLVTIEGEPVSLDDIEHRILRPIWNDPRIHYAVNCASVGCPDLIARGYTATDMDATLTTNAIAYVNSPRGVTINDGEITVSKIYDWFDEDFGGSEKGVIAHLLEYATGERKAALEKADGIDDYAYDWSLNGVE
ncbi:MAG: DUF547 domain-containing protein [Rhodospirillales bacterium]|nr:DUF547 domain-containing protein [Rhodospirillales bacterium]MBO6788580.1 DUF547 domain-containing protein [Rhodospirillales bacterium]